MLFVLASCARESTTTSSTGPDTDVEKKSAPLLVINEYSPKSNTLNEFNQEADWVELYNPSEKEFKIGHGHVSITDDPAEPGKYFLPEIVVPAHGHIVVWCDGLNTVNRDIHSNFKLSANGEEICLFISGEPVDDIYFDEEIKKSRSYGRVEDGADKWSIFESPSPGSSNQSSDNYAETLK